MNTPSWNLPPATPPSPPLRQAPAKKNVWLGVAVAATVAAGVVSAALLVGFKKGGFLSTTDVGQLSELAPIQAQLMPLDACEITYARRDKRGNRVHLESVFIRPCTGSRNDGVVLTVPRRSGVGFSMERETQSSRFEILVEKDDVPFPELVAALNAYTPIMVTQYATELERIRKQSQAFQESMRRQQKEAADRKAGAKQTYPSQ